MAGFVAFNVEPEELSEDDVDDTKEIQIEEALKLYQTALKLHSQELYEEAAVAYDNLFASEIFAYPESLPQAERSEFRDGSETHEGAISLSHNTNFPIQHTGIDGAPSTLAQILYLSYKNHGQFLLDLLLNDIRKDVGSIAPRNGLSEMLLSSLSRLVEALDRDDTDLELWRQVARICESLGSTRTARYCLEAVLTMDQDGSDRLSEPLRLDQIFAVENLTRILKALRDHLGEYILNTLSNKTKSVIGPLKNFIDPCPYLPQKSHRILDPDSCQEQAVCLIQLEARSWESCGKALMLHISQEDRDLVGIAAEARCNLLLPNKQASPIQQRTEIPEEKGSGHGMKCNTPGSVLQPGTDRHLSAGFRASSTLDEKLTPKRAGGECQVETDEEGQDQEAGVSHVPSLPKNSGSVHPLEDVPKNLREEDRVEQGPVEQSSKVTQTEEQPGGSDMTSKMGPVVSLPTRKRSSDSAGLQENVDMVRARSKRIKARGSTNEPYNSKEVATVELHQLHENKLRILDQADNRYFDAARTTLSKFEVKYSKPVNVLKDATLSFPSSENMSRTTSQVDLNNVAAQDFLNLLGTWNRKTSMTFLQSNNLDDKHGSSNNLGTPTNAGLSLFLEHSKRGSELSSQKPVLPEEEGLEAFASEIEQTWTFLDQLALKWIEELLAPRASGTVGAVLRSRYEAFIWPETLKETVVLMLVMKDEYIYSNIYDRLKLLDERLLVEEAHNGCDELQDPEKALVQTVQNIFEIHLDRYGKMINPSSEVDSPTRILQLERLERWAALAHDAISKKPVFSTPDGSLDNWDIRFLWASVLHTSLIDSTSRDHIILCFEELKRLLEEAGKPVIELGNNFIMPEVSIEAAEREISRVANMGFFLSLFNGQESNPLLTIEGLEPILEESIQMQGSINSDRTSRDQSDHSVDQENRKYSSNDKGSDFNSENSLSPELKQMLQFVSRANVSLKVILWEKLGVAYEAIAYPPKVLSCILRGIEIIAENFTSDSFIAKLTDDRCSSLLRWLRVVGELVTKALALISNESEIFYFIDEAHLRSSLKALVNLQRILYVQVFWEDSIRIGKVTPLGSKGAHDELTSAMSKLRGMLVRTCILQYFLIKEGFEQNPDVSKEPKQDLSKYLQCLHQALGLRNLCRVSNRLFPMFMRRELLHLGVSETSDLIMAQLIYDLYGLKMCPNPADLDDHGCPPGPLERETALEMIGPVMAQAKKMNIKDVGRSELKGVIDAIQDVIRIPTKPTSAMILNRRIMVALLRSPINPVNLYRALRGIGSLNGTRVRNHSRFGDKGWYVLIGSLLLAKFRSQKRLMQGPVLELEVAMTYFRQDIELGLETWETWYRLAQVLDSMIDDEVTWTAERLNKKMGEIITLQRHAIHCYTMALAAATRDEAASSDAADQICELYADFAWRMYVSSREPFSMDVFALQEFTKHYNGETRGMYQDHPFQSMRLYAVWKFASVLFHRALSHKSGKTWVNYYMLGKCLWKMHNCSDEIRGRARRVTHTGVLHAFTRSIELLPERRDNRHPEKDPTLEPHYKLVSVVHKLVQSKKLQPGEGCQYLKATSYARKHSPVQDLDAWEGYLIGVLKSLRSADKANWHHRMIARAAHVIYDDSSGDVMGALGAKHELTQQIFTKTMYTQVWKPDNERHGRHFVYTSRYVSFFIGILSQLNDRASLEILAKRVRKKPIDFFNHTKLWEELCGVYLKMLRRQGSVIEGNEDIVFKSIPYPTFVLNAERLQAWAQSTAPTHSILELLREVVELKKLNANLIKPGPIEELVGDTYALLYTTMVPDLVAKSNTEENRVRMRVDHLLTDSVNEKVPLVNGHTLDLTTPGVAPKQGRAKSVNRREIQRRAESLVLVKAPVPLPTSNVRTSSDSKILAAVEIPEKGEVSRLSNVNETLLTVKEREDGGKDIGSIPGSLHDSADDESELSDVEEMMEVEPGPRIMFPGLLGSRDARAKRGEEGGEEEEEEDEEEEEEEDGREEEEKGEEEHDAQRLEQGEEEDGEDISGKGKGAGEDAEEKKRDEIETDDRNSNEEEDNENDGEEDDEESHSDDSENDRADE